MKKFVFLVILFSVFIGCTDIEQMENSPKISDPFLGSESVLYRQNEEIFTQYSDDISQTSEVMTVNKKIVSKVTATVNISTTNTSTNINNDNQASTITNTYNMDKGYPIILVHGYAGSDKWIGLIDYFYKVEKTLRAEGYKVYTADMNAFGFSADYTENGKFYEGRSTQLKKYVLQVLAETGASKVNIIAHSQGGCTSRYMITNQSMSSKVNCLFTISTPHYGTDLLEIIAILPTPLKKLVENVVMDFFLGSIASGDTNPASAHAHIEMLPSYMINSFNPNTPNVSTVKYFSVAGQMTSTNILNIMLAPHLAFRVLDAKKGGAIGPDDGIVPVNSSKWGTWLGTITGRKILGIRYGVDHAGEINQPLGLFTYFDALKFYSDTAKFLKAQN